MYKRLFLLLGALAMIGGGFWIWQVYQPQRKMDKALQHVLLCQYPQAEELLKTFSLPIHSALCCGYLEMSRSRFELAGQYLETAEKEAIREHQLHLQSEIALAQAMNSFYKGELQAFCTYVQKARITHDNHNSLAFFEGLESYLNKSYADALLHWNLDTNTNDDSKWFDNTLNFLFPSAWRKLHAAHCFIELGDITNAKEIIENASCLAGHEEVTQQLAHLMLGLSYLKEAGQTPYDQRGSYYKLAQFYFERVKFTAKLTLEKDLIIPHIEEETKRLLSINKMNGDKQWGFDFLHILQDWKAQGSIERLVDCLSHHLCQQKDESSVELCKKVCEEFQGTPFYEMLTEKMLGDLIRDVRSGEIDDLFSSWAQIEQLVPNPLAAAKRVAALTADEIFEMIRKDNLSLTRTRNYLVFWEKLGRSSCEKELLAGDLLIFAKTFWHFEQQETKGQNLMEIALLLSNRHPIIENEISHFLITLFKQAESSNMISRLLIVYDTMGHFGMNRQELISKSTLANYTADAEYLYRVNNYIAAKMHAGWILKLDPQNEGALRVAGLASFQLGEFGLALAYLQQMAFHDGLTHQALMLSLVCAPQDQAKHLCQMNPAFTYASD
jgi:Protein of unknown function (DUF1347)